MSSVRRSPRVCKKTDASGVAVLVWQDDVAGTDPTNALSKFTAKIEMKDGAVIVTWSPALNGEGVRDGVRVYSPHVL